MPGNELEELDALVRSGALDGAPDVKRAAIAKLSAAKPAPVAGPSHAPIPQPVPDPLAERMEKYLSQPTVPHDEKLPTAYYPTQEKSHYPVLYTEPSMGDGDRGWKRAMTKAEQEGRRAYRVSQEMSMEPEVLKKQDAYGLFRTLVTRGVTDVLGPFGLGADLSMTGGLASKGLAKGVGKYAGVDINQDLERMRQSSPAASAAGSLAGATGPGLARGAGVLAEKVVSPIMKGVVGKTIGYALGGALGGGATSGVEAGVGKLMGEDRNVAREAGVGAAAGAAANLAFGGLGELGRNRQDALRRSSGSGEAQDLALVEKAGGRTSIRSGVRPDVEQGVGPQKFRLRFRSGTKQGGDFADSINELDEAAKESGQGIDALAANRAANQLGPELESYRAGTVGKVAAENEAMYANQARVSAEPIVRKNMELLRKSTSPDGTELPGHVTSALGKEMPKMANIRVVSASDDAAHAADPEMVIPAGTAAKLGIIPRSQGKPGMVAVIEPRSMSLEDIDRMARMYTNRSSLGEYDPATEPMKDLAGAARSTRGRFGSAVERAKEEQSAALNEMKNALEASGLPRDAAKVDMGDVGTADALYGAARRYKTGASVPKDLELDKLAARSPELRSKLDQSAAVGAYQRLRGQATPNIAMGPSGTVRPWGFSGALKLRMDPIMGAFGQMGKVIPGLPYGISSEAARRGSK